jgi:hypothetical protein
MAEPCYRDGLMLAVLPLFPSAEKSRCTRDWSPLGPGGRLLVSHIPTCEAKTGHLIVLRHKTRRMLLLNRGAQYGHLGSALAIATIKV